MTPSRARFTVLRFAFALSVITYLDRVCIATAAASIRQELKLGAIQMGLVFSAFTLAYALFEIPSGWLADTIRPRKVLTRIVLWWSVFTMATGLAWDFASLLSFRFLFGAGEAGAFPAVSRSFSEWFPARERGRAHGVIFMGTRVGGALAPPAALALITRFGWRPSFWMFGTLGVVWAAIWWKWFRDDPQHHPSVNPAELQIIHDGGTPLKHQTLEWRRLCNRNFLFVCLTYFAFGYGLYFYLTWLPTYLREALGFSATGAGMWSSIVLLSGAGSSIVGGLWTDGWSKKYGLKMGRCGVLSTTLVASGAVLGAAALTKSPIASAALIAIAAGIADLSIAAAWAVCHDIGGEAAGTVTACMNTFANFAGVIAPIAMGYAVQSYGSWTFPMLVTALVYIAGGAIALYVDPNKPILR
jgi:MFS family permease